MLALPTVKGVIRRRILVNYRIDVDIAARQLPDRFRPKLIHGSAMGGICLIRLEEIRPTALPSTLGFASENAAHRIAVEWDEADGTVNEGVFIPARSTNSFLNHVAGGRIFPGEHHLARFDVDDDGDTIDLSMKSDDFSVHVRAHTADALPSTSVFASMTEASRYFENGSIGYSARRKGDTLDEVRLEVTNWQVAPLALDDVRSSYFEDQARFPIGSAILDSALIMRNVDHQWRAVAA